MRFLTACLIGVGLAADAFAVSLSGGMCARIVRLRHILRMAGCFGLFQGLMPLLGYTVARTFASHIQAIDHWVAFGLLSLVGVGMIREARKKRPGTVWAGANVFAWRRVLPMALATSVDALAAGASMAVLPHVGLLALPGGVLLCCLTIALITFALCTASILLGCRSGTRLGQKAQWTGGLLLIGIGLKILLTDLIGG